MNLTVLSAGAWGMALAAHASAFHPTGLWAHDATWTAGDRCVAPQRPLLAGGALPAALAVTPYFDAAVAHAAGGLLLCPGPRLGAIDRVCPVLPQAAPA